MLLDSEVIRRWQEYMNIFFDKDNYKKGPEYISKRNLSVRLVLVDNI